MDGRQGTRNLQLVSMRYRVAGGVEKAPGDMGGDSEGWGAMNDADAMDGVEYGRVGEAEEISKMQHEGWE